MASRQTARCGDQEGDQPDQQNIIEDGRPLETGKADPDGANQKEYKRITEELSKAYKRWEVLAELAE